MDKINKEVSKNQILKKMSIYIGSFLIVMALVAWFFGVFDLLFSGVSIDEDMTRTDIQEELVDLEKSGVNQDDLKLKTELAYHYYFLGNFVKAEEVIKEVVDENPDFFNPYSLLAELYYLRGDYGESENIMLSQLEKNRFNVNVVAKCQARLLKIYYQTNQYNKVEDYSVLKSVGGGEDFANWIESFEGQPNIVSFEGSNQSELSFLFLNPLPIVEIQINGVKTYAFIDTGADVFTMNSSSMESYDINMSGSFGGGMTEEVGFGKLRKLQLGNAVIENVPIMLMPLDDMTNGFLEEFGEDAPDGFRIDGIIGTKVLQQFFATLDYIDEKLILRERNNDSFISFQKEIENSQYEAFPFYMENLHTLVAKGQFIDKDVMFYLDSGLAGNASMLVAENTLKDMKMTIPEVAFDEDAYSGGGVGYELAMINNVGSAGFGDFIKLENTAEYDPATDMYWESDFIVDAMLSHNYLKNYRWTIDFDHMKMYLVKE